MMVCAAGGSGAQTLRHDTLSFVFSLYGQTRRVSMVPETRGDSLLMRWSMGRGLVTYSGCYAMGRGSVEEGARLCLLQPEAGRRTAVPEGETAFILSRAALRQLRDSACLTYGGTRYELADSAVCAPGVPSFHVRDRAEGCEMWIVDDMRMPLIWRVTGNPLGIDWHVENAGQYFAAAAGGLRVAFISDAHVQDVEGCPELARTMRSEVRSTRLFNENVFAFRAALDDAAGRGIRTVVLPGDLTDNGQRVNVEAVRRILDDYSRRCGMSFFVTTGNHDPVCPEGCGWRCADFLAADGSTPAADSVAVADSMLHCCGYEEIMREWGGFGFAPRREYLYWATPFSTYSYEDYTLAKAVAASGTEARSYMLCDTLRSVDASYVAEPVRGLWLLSVDGGVYLPGGSAGYAGVLRYKPFLLKWIARVAADARRLGKTLVAFSHYPAADFHSGAEQEVREWLGDGAMNLRRVPPRGLSEALLEAGVRLHFAGHIHQNHTAVVENESGDRLYSIQVPSVAAYMPAYKILTVGADGYRVETVTLDSVPGFRALWPRYMREYARGKDSGGAGWSQDILYSPDYVTFCDMHFRNLVASRYIPGEMPSAVRDSVTAMSGLQLMRVATGNPGWLPPAGHPLAWTGTDMITDLYRLHFAGGLARRHIPEERMGQYMALFAALDGNTAALSEVAESLRHIGRVMRCFASGQPDTDFIISKEAR